MSLVWQSASSVLGSGRTDRRTSVRINVVKEKFESKKRVCAIKKKVLWIMNNVLLCISALYVVPFILFETIDELFGPAQTERILHKLKIPLQYNQVVLWGIVFISIFCASVYFRYKMRKKGF